MTDSKTEAQSAPNGWSRLEASARERGWPELPEIPASYDDIAAYFLARLEEDAPADHVDKLKAIAEAQAAPDSADWAYLTLAATERTHTTVSDPRAADHLEFVDANGAPHVVEVVR